MVASPAVISGADVHRAVPAPSPLRRRYEPPRATSISSGRRRANRTGGQFWPRLSGEGDDLDLWRGGAGQGAPTTTGDDRGGCTKGRLARVQVAKPSPLTVPRSAHP